MEQGSACPTAMPKPHPRFAALVLAFLAACGPPRQTPAGGPSVVNLPPYTAAEAALLDDRLSPEVFGAEVDPSDPVGRRAALGDGIVRARLTTVTRDTSGRSEAFVLDLQPVPPALKGPDISERLTLTIPTSNPSFAFVKSFEAELVGRPVIVIYKRFSEGGQATLRWHIEAENPRVLQAIDRARIMGELGR